MMPDVDFVILLYLLEDQISKCLIMFTQILFCADHYWVQVSYAVID